MLSIYKIPVLMCTLFTLMTSVALAKPPDPPIVSQAYTGFELHATMGQDMGLDVVSADTRELRNQRIQNYSNGYWWFITLAFCVNFKTTSSKHTKRTLVPFILLNLMDSAFAASCSS